MKPEELAGKKYVFIAGGVGTAPVYPQVKWLHERGVAVDVIIGAKTKDLVIYKDEMEAVCDNLYICTDDGTEGFKGLVTAMLEKLVNEDGKVVKEGATNQSSPVLNGQSAMIIDLNDIEAGSYKLVVNTFVSEKKADQPLNINGVWECDFSK